MKSDPTRTKFKIAYLCVLAPYVGLLWVPFYNRVQPSLAGIPFFYWYQMLWIGLGSLVMVPLYLALEKK